MAYPELAPAAAMDAWLRTEAGRQFYSDDVDARTRAQRGLQELSRFASVAGQGHRVLTEQDEPGYEIFPVRRKFLIYDEYPPTAAAVRAAAGGLNLKG